MAILMWIGIGLGSVIVILAIIGFLSPRYAVMSRSVKIGAKPSEVFPHLNSMREFYKWSPWTEKDPDAKITYEGPETGVGSKYLWVGDRKKVGSGSLEIIESVENQKVNCDLKFDGRNDSEAGWIIEDHGDSSTVTWHFKGDMGNNPAGRLFGRMMDKFLGPDYEKGLQNLKNRIENE